MTSDKKLIVLPTRQILIKFYETMRSSSNQDYETEQILEEIIGALFTVEPDLKTLRNLAEWYKVRYVTDQSAPEDGEIIARATFELGQGLQEIFTRSGFYDSQGTLHCDYYQSLTDDIVVRSYV